MALNKAKELDQFYTKPEIAKQCYDILLDILKQDNGDIKMFIEPSAGNGSFYSILPIDRRLGFDIEPAHPEVVERDFLKTDIVLDGFDKKNICFIGNPPFGKRSKLALEFFLHAADFGDIIAFIVPVQWQKWSVQSKIPKDWKLVKDNLLQQDAFLYKGKSYKVRCSFQIWKKNTTFVDLRMKEKLPTEHPDFTMYLYNNTKEAMKYFDYDWDFAVPRQGWADYTRRETDKNKCEKTTQWIFIKAKNAEIKNVLYNINYEFLASKNTSTPGWGKADLVQHYSNLTEDKQRRTH
jgi:hypothetical protein